MFCVLFMLSLFVWPAICYKLAKDKNLDTALAVVVGVIFGLFAVIYYACIAETATSKQDNKGVN